jgi:tRNA (guanine37-N1)-methyltransferase
MFEPIKHSIINRAVEKNVIDINLINIRDFSKDKHNHVDDTPYGGGAGMVMQADVVYDAYNSIEGKENAKVIYLTPKGQTLNQSKVRELSKEDHLILLCGHYEGIDQRVLDEIVDEEISVGDYVLTGGELPAMVVVDSVSRYVNGVLSEGSTNEESFSNNLLEYPQYTRPENFNGKTVPEVLTSGNHQEIAKWRFEQSLITTYKKRPDLLTEEQSKQAEELLKNSQN